MSPRLDYVALACSDPDALASLLVDRLGLALGEAHASGAAALVAAGEVALALFEVGDPRLEGAAVSGLHHLGLAVEDVTDFARDAGLAAGAATLDGIPGEQLAVDPAATGGVRLRLGAPVARAPATADRLVERIDHVGVASVDNRAAETLFVDRLGFAVESRQTDMEVRTVVESFTSDRYGVVYHSRAPEPVGGLRVSFVTVADCELEFLEEMDRETMSASRAMPLGRTPGSTRQDQGAIGRFVERRGPGLHHLALKIADIDGTLARLRDAGVRTIDAVGRPGSRRARIGFIHPSASGGVLIHLVERSPLGPGAAGI